MTELSSSTSPAAGTPLLEVCDAELRYGEARALNGVSLALQSGTITALIGPNGAGKSSLLKAISGMHPLHAGTMRFAGQALLPMAMRQRAQQGIAHVPEGRRLFSKMSVEENLRLGGYLLAGAAAVNEALEQAYSVFPRLRERARQRAGSLSGGEQQMLAIGRALMSRPRLLMADEVSQGLAPLMVQEVYRQLAAINARGVTLLLVEQNARLALRVAHYAYVMEQGRIALQGPAAEVASSDHVRDAYLGIE